MTAHPPADPVATPEVLRQYAVVADGERGALVGPRGDVALLCAPRWHDDAVFSGILGGPGAYVVRPADDHFVWGGSYERDTLVWRSRWVATHAVIECHQALAYPGDPDRVVLLRRVVAEHGAAHVRVVLDVRAGFGTHPMSVARTSGGVWHGHSGDLAYRWSGATGEARLDDGRLALRLVVPPGESRDLVLELSRGALPHAVPDAGRLWCSTRSAWRDRVPDLATSAAPGDSRHSCAVLHGLTGRSGAMVAAATTSLPERADQGRNYDYRYAWIRDQCYAGRAAAAIGDDSLLDSAVRFVSARLHDDGPDLEPAYTVTGERVPAERDVALPGYPGAPVRVGNRVRDQMQLDVFGETLLLLSAAAGRGRIDHDGRAAASLAAEAVRRRRDEPDAGIWELGPRRWAHSRLMCAAGLRAASATGLLTPPAEDLADAIVRSVDADCLHPSGRWQRAPGDAGVDAALLLPGLRGAVPADDPRHLRTIEAVIADLCDDGYVYRFRQDPHRPLHAAEGAFLLGGFHLSLARLGTGHREDALRWFERTRSALGPPGLFAEEYDVAQRQLRGNLPQAFVHALLLESAHRLGEAGVERAGFEAQDR